jgi:hypothetical protein
MAILFAQECATKVVQKREFARYEYSKWRC